MLSQISPPITTFEISENHASHFIRIKRCPAAEKFNLELDQEYEMHVSPQDITIQSKDVKAPLLQWPLHHIKKVWMDTAEQPEGEAADGVCIETTKYFNYLSKLIGVHFNHAFTKMNDDVIDHEKY